MDTPVVFVEIHQLLGQLKSVNIKRKTERNASRAYDSKQVATEFLPSVPANGARSEKITLLAAVVRILDDKTTHSPTLRKSPTQTGI